MILAIAISLKAISLLSFAFGVTYTERKAVISLFARRSVGEKAAAQHQPAILGEGSYLIGQAVGILPLILSNQFSSFLFIENKGRITQLAVLVYIAVNLLLNYLFVAVMHMEALGLALASSMNL